LVVGTSLRRLFVICVVLLVASCSGGGCSSGCASCGTTPLPGGFPKVDTVPNAAAVRVTRPGLNFLQENLSTIGIKALGTSAPGGIASFDIPKSSTSGADICPDASPPPPKCKAEIDLGNAKLRVDATTPNHVLLDGLLPVRIRDLPVSLLGFARAYVVAGDKAQIPSGNFCDKTIRGAPTFPFKDFPLTVDLPLVAETRLPRDGYTKVDVANATIDIQITQNDMEICDDTCGGNPLCQGLFSAVKSLAFNLLIGGVKDQIKNALAGSFCTAPSPTVTPPCPTGSQPDNADVTKAKKCVFVSNTAECVPALLGTDGRMDLGKALASFSPGTQGGLDFVLASAGDMNPAPGAAGVPGWTPKKPPVPATDNNANGLSLSMLGGAQPHPNTKCVQVAENPPPQGIPVPKELTDDSVGTHLGVSLAGRYLGHALVSAYNSGILCVGISTDQVTQLNSGYLSLVAPSIKNLTFEGNNGAAAISTRPGVAPKVVIGGGTNPDSDPLIAITLEKFAIDFYVFSFDRFVRMFTYTADLTVPVSIQTGKDPKTNPNGGLLPVLGKIQLANGAVTGSDLLMEDGGLLAGAMSGLFGTVVSQFLGSSGFKPIDLTSALKAAGLGMEIPQGGIRKLTSGSDDFIGLFANLTLAPGAAREEVETRAEIIEKIVDASAMSLTTADRARYPRLRVHAEGIATKPTEQTWWVDDGTHAAWTTSHDLVVDADTMLMQGKHVLHVSSRIVNDIASEDSTPVDLPFTIDTLAPEVRLERNGTKVRVIAFDFVSERDALLVRFRRDAEAFSEWQKLVDLPPIDLASAVTLDVEVKDEEGNVQKVQEPLIRGRADSTLAGSGSGCGCSVPGGDRDRTLALLSCLAIAIAIAVRRLRPPTPPRRDSGRSALRAPPPSRRC
jgi:hypothetical protein